MTALSRLLLAPLRPLRGAVRVARVSPAVDARIAEARESRRAWERDLAGWIAREAAVLLPQRRHHAAWRARRVAAGLCGSCCARPAPEGLRTCEECRKSLRAAKLQREAALRARGMCARCGVRPLASTLRCAECLAAEASAKRAEYRARVSDDVNGGCDVG